MSSPSTPIPLCNFRDRSGTDELTAALDEQRCAPGRHESAAAAAPAPAGPARRAMLGARLPGHGGAVVTAVRTGEPKRRAALATVVAVGPGFPGEAATAIAAFTGARLIEQRLPDGRPDRAIVAVARSAAADLIVVDAGLLPPCDLEPLLRPSLDAGFNVLAVPPGVGAELVFKRVGVALDGSAAAQRALATAVELASAAVDAVAYVDVVYVDNGFSPSDELDAGELASSRDAMVAWWLETLSDEVPAMVRPLRLVGDPAQLLADLSLDLDLLIVGRRRRSRLRRMLEGSVSADLLRRARCPILVVPGR